MRSDQVAEIVSLLREVFDAAREPSPQDGDLCATFEVVGRPEAWAQVTSTELNVSYPLTTSPDDELREILRGLPAAQLISWEPSTFATWSFVSRSPTDIAKVVDQILARLFSLGDYAVDGQLENL